MAQALRRSEKIRRFIIRHIDRHPKDIVRVASEAFAVSRPAVLRHVNRLIDDGVVKAEGSRKARRYALALLAEHSMSLPLTADVEEHEVWNVHIAPFMDGISSAAYQLCQFGFTEMVNNAIDHSSGSELFVGVRLSPITVHLAVVDNGVGIFRKVTDALGLEDERHAVLELSKGKLTTDPRRHSGEGIYFTSRAFDEFTLWSGKLMLTHAFQGSDWLIERKEPVNGTHVEMITDVRSTRTLQSVFKAGSSPDDPGFTRTHIPVYLAEYGDENLVSRSQAKRLLTRVDRFKEVVLDFQNVKVIGQAFADEIFRVFQNEHPDVHITTFRANEDVRRMITHVSAGAAESARGG